MRRAPRSHLSVRFGPVRCLGGSAPRSHSPLKIRLLLACTLQGPRSDGGTDVALVSHVERPSHRGRVSSLTIRARLVRVPIAHPA